MKRLVGILLAIILAPAVYAADIGKTGKIVTMAPAEAQDNQSWNRTGMYVGAIGAYDITVLEAEGVDLNNGKLMAGVAVGWNFRVAPALVLGLEGDWLFTGISTSHTEDEVTLKATTDHLVSLRLRAGVPVGPALLYATGGLAWQQSKIRVGDGEVSISERSWQQGWAFGGGAEVELTRTVALGLEAIHYVFPNDGAPLNELFDSENQHTAVRARLLFKLN